MTKASFIIASILSASLIFPSLAYSDDPSSLKIKLEKDRIILKQGNDSYFYPLNKFYGIKQIETRNLDKDGREEYTIGAQLKDGQGVPYGCVLICQKKGDSPIILRRINTGDYFDKFELQDIPQGNLLLSWILAWGSSGAHHQNLVILDYHSGQPISLFEKGSAAGVEFKISEQGVPQVWVGRANWKDPSWCYAAGKRLWEVHQWNGKEFRYESKLSTTDLLSEEEETQRYVDKVMKKSK